MSDALKDIVDRLKPTKEQVDSFIEQYADKLVDPEVLPKVFYHTLKQHIYFNSVPE